MSSNWVTIQNKFTDSEIEKILGSKKYNPHYHCAQIIAILAAGDGSAEFCSLNNISHETFSVWNEKHPEFHAAYLVAKQKGKAWWEKIAKQHLTIYSSKDKDEDTVKFNQTLWSMIMRNRFGYTEHRRIGVKGIEKLQENQDSKFSRQFNKLLDAMSEEQLTAHEAQQFAKLLESGAKLYETEQLVGRLESLEKLVKQSN
jgi:hypothetical protein